MLLLDIKNLTIELKTPDGLIRAVDRVNLSLREGETRGLVGESGSGKSLIAKAIVGVLNKRWLVNADRFNWCGQDLLRLPYDQQRKVIGRDIAMIYQEPSRSLDPTAAILEQLEEAIPDHLLDGPWWKRSYLRRRKAIGLLHKVGIRDHQSVLQSYPYQLSEGVCQKIMIAMAIAKNPKLLIADEPTTALDVTIQAQILELLTNIQKDLGMSLLLITHDLGVVAGFTEKLTVMYAGKAVEQGATAEVLGNPNHPYTLGLLRSIPRLDRPRTSELRPIQGVAPDMSKVSVGCSFQPRCEYAQSKCATENPLFSTISKD